MIIISAMTKDRVIGIGEHMPWSVPDEYEQYLRFVDGHTVIMGRKTYEVFGDDLSAETTPVVVSRGANFEDVHVATSLDEALSHAESLGKKVFVAGGSSIYTLAVPIADEMYLSTIKGDFEGDAYFPEFDRGNWEIVEEREESEYVFRKYRRLSH